MSYSMMACFLETLYYYYYHIIITNKTVRNALNLEDNIFIRALGQVTYKQSFEIAQSLTSSFLSSLLQIHHGTASIILNYVLVLAYKY